MNDRNSDAPRIPRVAAHKLFGHRLGSLKLAIVFLAVAGMIAFLSRSRRTASGA